MLTKSQICYMHSNKIIRIHSSSDHSMSQAFFLEDWVVRSSKHVGPVQEPSVLTRLNLVSHMWNPVRWDKEWITVMRACAHALSDRQFIPSIWNRIRMGSVCKNTQMLSYCMLNKCSAVIYFTSLYGKPRQYYKSFWEINSLHLPLKPTIKKIDALPASSCYAHVKITPKIVKKCNKGRRYRRNSLEDSPTSPANYATKQMWNMRTNVNYVQNGSHATIHYRVHFSVLDCKREMTDTCENLYS